MNKIRNNSGFSLVELLVVLGILSIVGIMASDLFSNSMRAYKNDDAQWQIQQDARHAVKEITKDVRNADSIVVTLGDDEDPSKSILTLNLDGVATVIKWAYDTNNEKVLYRIVNGGKNLIIRNVEDIIFDYPGNVLNISVTTKKADKEFNLSVSLSKRVNKQ